MQKRSKCQSIRYRTAAAIEAYNNLVLDSIDTIDLDFDKDDELNNQISTEDIFCFKKINRKQHTFRKRRHPKRQKPSTLDEATPVLLYR